MIQIEKPRDFTPYWQPDLPNDEYHGDRTAISSSQLVPILKSPATFATAYTQPDKPTKAKTEGTAFHLALLEGPEFLSRYVIQPEFGDLRKTENKAKKKAFDESLPEGAIPLKKETYDQLNGMIEAAYSHRDAKAILENTENEISGYYADPLTGIKSRIRPDCLSLELGIIADVKTTRSVEEWSFAKAIWEYRLDLRLFMYAYGAEAISKVKITDKAFIAIEKDYPYEVAVYEPDPEMWRKAEADFKTAMHRLSTCIDSGEWPRYQARTQQIGLPRYAFYA